MTTESIRNDSKSYKNKLKAGETMRDNHLLTFGSFQFVRPDHRA